MPIAIRPAGFPASGLAGLAALLVFASATPEATAQGRLDARYTVTLAGIPLGKGAWVIDIADDRFTAAASGSAAGVMRILSSGQGSGASRGHMVGGAPVPASFGANVTSDSKTDEVRIQIERGVVKDYSFTPPVPPNPERVPVTDAHRRNVFDPMTGALYRVPGNGDLFVPEACPRNVAVFDGRMRYDLQFAYKRTDQVKADRGYEGPAVVCSVFFRPIAGHIPSRPGVKYLIEQRDMEVALVPIAGTRVMVPFRVSIPTPIGVGIMQATQFVSNGQPRAAAGPKTQ